MRDWHHNWQIDIGLRLGGATLCGLAWLLIRTLLGLYLPQNPAVLGAGALALAAGGFLCASLGLALLTLGHHLFDTIEVGERWRATPRPDERAASRRTRL